MSADAPAAKVLSETEIQERLYGEYLGKQKGKAAAPVEPGPDSEWTGKEILQGELQRLRSELISLRKERESLLAQFARWPEPRRARPAPFFVKWLGLILAGGLAGYPVGSRIIQAASPLGAEPTPYTVQVAVYDVEPMAGRMLEYLQGLGYSAFLTESPNRQGKTRYRIYVGRFVTPQEAEREKVKLVSDPRFSDAFVRLR